MSSDPRSSGDKFITTRLWRSVVVRVDALSKLLTSRALGGETHGANVSRSRVVEMALDAFEREQSGANKAPKK